MITQFIKNKLPFNIINYLAIILGLLIIISINSNSSHLKVFFDLQYKFNLDTFLIIFNTTRLLLPFIIFMLMIIIILLNLNLLCSHGNHIFFKILILNFLYQIIIYKFNFLKFEITYVQLAINCLNFTILYILANTFGLKFFEKYFFYLIFLIFFLLSIFFCTKILINTIDADAIYMYSSQFSNPSGKFLDQPNPRVTGLSKILVLYFAFHFFIFFRVFNKKKFLIFNYLILFICMFFIYGLQTRNSLVGICIFLFIYFFFINENKIKKFKNLILIFFIPIIFYELSMNNISQVKIDVGNNEINNTPLLENNRYLENNRFFEKNTGLKIHSSGRISLWKLAIDNIKDSSIIFGVGPQGDRQIFNILKKNKSYDVPDSISWSTSVSNGLLYSYLSGGIVSLLLIISIYIIIIKEVFIAVFINKLFSKNVEKELVSIFCLIYLCFRSLYENGFTVFGSDYVFLIITFYNIYQFNLKYKSIKK